MFSMTASLFRTFVPVVALAGVTVTFISAAGGTIQATFDEPSFDRWMYPFNQTPGTRGASSTFGTFQEPDFDNRDGQMLIGFDTTGVVTPGLGVGAYNIISARITVQNTQDETFVHDDTQDSYRVFLDPDDPEYLVDADPGQPLELYGVGFRNGLSRLTFTEDMPYSFSGPLGRGIRNAHALGFDATNTPIDVSLNVAERFDPAPWAIATIPDPNVLPGDAVPFGTDIVFDIDLADPNVQAYFAESLDDGILDLSITALARVEVMQPELPEFFNKENALVLLGEASAARLEIEVEILGGCPEDLSGNDVVDFADIVALLAAWGDCADCPEDLDQNGVVDFADVVQLLAAWGPCPQ